MKNKTLKVIGEVCLIVGIGIFIFISPFETFINLLLSFVMTMIVYMIIER